MSVLDYLSSNALNILGITLALLDFTGTSKRVEVALRRYIEVEKQDALEFKEELFTTNLAYHWRAFVSFLPSAAVFALFLTGIWFFAEGTNRMLWLVGYIELLPWWSGFILLPVVIIGWYATSHVITHGGAYLISIVIWRFFWLLSLPKAGILGTLGLLVTLADNFAGQII